MIRRLRLKMVCINMVLVTLMLCTMFGMILQMTRVNLENESRQMVQQLSSERGRPGPFGGPEHGVQLPYIVIEITMGGNVNAWGQFDVENVDLGELLTAVSESGASEGVLEDSALQFAVSQTPMGQKVVLLDISSHRTTLHNLLRTCISIGAITFVLFLGVSFLLAGWAVKPVEQAWQQQRQFVGDASHELKTPLTVILTNAELLQDETYDPESRQQFADHILTMARQMRGLVEDLLELARVDNGLARKAYVTVDWSSLVSDAVLPFEPLFFEHDLMLETRIDPGLTLKGDENRLRQVVEILLDNAMKYSTPGGTVNLELTREGRNHARLCVSSPGTSLTAQERQDIFRRFYRTDKVRTIGHSYGLGLPIAKGIAEQHDGKIWAESTEDRNQFFVDLPMT